MRYRFQFPVDLCFTICAKTEEEARTKGMQHVEEYCDGYDLPDHQQMDARIYSYPEEENAAAKLEIINEEVEDDDDEELFCATDLGKELLAEKRATDGLTDEQIRELADEHADACYEDDGEAAYGREE